MKDQFIRVVLAALLALSSFALKDDVICHGDNDCYPRVFVPSTEWQPVREDQEVPAGLHVRLNMETNEREAKLLPKEESRSDSGLVAMDSNIEDRQEEIREKIRQFKAEKDSTKSKERAQVKESEFNDFSSALLAALDYDNHRDSVHLGKALDTLTELSHDREFGIKLTQDPQTFTLLLELAIKTNDPKIQDQIYRIFAASLSNNPEGVANFIKNGHTLSFLDTLFVVIHDEPNDVLQKRALGVVQGLAGLPQLVTKVSSSVLLSYSRLGVQARDRAVAILHDFGLLDESDDTPDVKVSKYLQRALEQGFTGSDHQLRQFFTCLSELHEKASLQPSSSFMQWLSKEAESRKSDSSDFSNFLLEKRHTVFGNPNSHRVHEDL